MDKYTGKRLDGRYEIKELIGKGGMARVYKAYDSIDDRIVAIKILKDEFLDNKDFIRRFKNESKAIAVLSHPNIVKVFDVSFGDIIQYIVMEYIEGITLKEYITQQKTILWKDAVYFTNQILKALQHAHSKGIIHRDIKPQNMMLLKDGTIKVTDFGIARFSKHETYTMTDKAIGSVHYISPEQARGDVTDEKADIYSVGVMLYEMLTGKLPFEADNAVSVAIMQMQADPISLREENDKIPEGLEEITLKAMQKEPENRYASAKEMFYAIEKFKMDPSIRFEYKYFSDDGNTKYLDAINSSRKNENYGDNYKIMEEEAEESKYDKKRNFKKKKLVIVLITAVLLIAAILGLCVFAGVFDKPLKDVDVPDFIGMKLSEVQSNPKYSKFTWNIEYVYDSNYAEEIILGQEPKAGSKKVKENATINLKVNSTGTMLVIPTVKGLTEEAAIAKLKDSGFAKVEVENIVDNNTSKGVVKGTNPEEGLKVKANEKIKIYVSKGPAEAKIAIPDVRGFSLDAAIKELIAKGLKVNSNINYKSNVNRKDIVLETDPLVGVEVKVGTQVTLTVSGGIKTQLLSIPLPRSNAPTTTADMTVMIDGVEDKSLAQKVNLSSSLNSQVSVNINGDMGKKKVAIYLDGTVYKDFEIDFDSDPSRTKDIKTYPWP